MIAFFPGKFQPPHIGHVLTIVRIYEKYDKIIIGVTEDGPIVMSQKERVDILQDIFKYMERVEIILLPGILTEYEDFKLLPEFDICLSGNKKVVEKISSFGINAKHLNRSQGIGFSGTEMRSLRNSGA